MEKRSGQGLSGNDTLANGSHQAGPYIPRDFLFAVFPALNRREIKNPDVRFNLYVDSHADAREVRAIWYNNRFHDTSAARGRDETRVTGFGGGASALLDPESTGALTVFAFRKVAEGETADCHVWVCRHETEEDLVEDRVGPVEPGKYLIWPPTQQGLFAFLTQPPVRASCWLEEHEIPEEWRRQFPSGADIIRRAVELRPDTSLDPDRRLMRRRECEFEIFRSVEQAIEMPHIAAGFETIDAFISRAQTILQRRKARSGHSLELHAKAIFVEERLAEGTHFSHQPESEPGKRPDFLFPSAAAYHDHSFPPERLPNGRNGARLSGVNTKPRKMPSRRSRQLRMPSLISSRPRLRAEKRKPLSSMPRLCWNDRTMMASSRNPTSYSMIVSAS
jgi:hypothetical protein